MYVHVTARQANVCLRRRTTSRECFSDCSMLRIAHATAKSTAAPLKQRVDRRSCNDDDELWSTCILLH